MRRVYLLFLLPFLISCKQPQQEKILEKEVMEIFNQFYDKLDNDVDKIRDYVTDDFMVFELSRKWNTDEFIEFVKGFGEFESKIAGIADRPTAVLERNPCAHIAAAIIKCHCGKLIVSIEAKGVRSSAKLSACR